MSLFAANVVQTSVMEPHLKPETLSGWQALAAQTGRSPDELVGDAMASYLHEIATVRETFDRRFDEMESD